MSRGRVKLKLCRLNGMAQRRSWGAKSKVDPELAVDRRVADAVNAARVFWWRFIFLPVILPTTGCQIRPRGCGSWEKLGCAKV